jgi:hypothetical protein
MALKKPLVIKNGQIQQLQSGDSLEVPLSGALEITLKNGNAGSITKCQTVYIDDNNSCDLAQADAIATSVVIGLVNEDSITTAETGQIAVDGIISATTEQWDAVAGTTGGLVAGTKYFLSSTDAGKITSTAPTTTSELVVLIGVAISTTELDLRLEDTILL